jgi:hypothetical protein
MTLAIVFLRLAMVARSRASSSLGAPRSLTLVELVFQVGVTLGERVAGDAGFDGERDGGERAVGPLGGNGQDAVHRGADLVPFSKVTGHARVPSTVMRVRS